MARALATRPGRAAARRDRRRADRGGDARAGRRRSRRCATEGIAIVWIEHIVHALLRVAERLICMSAGRVIADGEPDAVMADAGRDRGLPGERGADAAERRGPGRAPRPAAGRPRRVAVASRRARRSRWSAPTAPASRRCCAPSRAPSRGRRRRGSCSTARTSRACARTSACAAGSRSCPRAGYLFPSLTVEENLQVAGAARARGRSRRVLEAFPHAARAPPAPRRHAVGRRAAGDARSAAR